MYDFDSNIFKIQHKRHRVIFKTRLQGLVNQSLFLTNLILTTYRIINGIPENSHDYYLSIPVWFCNCPIDSEISNIKFVVKASLYQV